MSFNQLPTELRLEVYKYLFPDLKRKKQLNVSVDLRRDENEWLREGQDIKSVSCSILNNAIVGWFYDEVTAYTTLLTTCKKTRDDMLSMAETFEIVVDLDQQVMDLYVYRAKAGSYGADEVYFDVPWYWCTAVRCYVRQYEFSIRVNRKVHCPVKYTWSNLRDFHLLLVENLTDTVPPWLLDTLTLTLDPQSPDTRVHPRWWRLPIPECLLDVDYEEDGNVDEASVSENSKVLWPEDIPNPQRLEDLKYLVHWTGRLGTIMWR